MLRGFERGWMIVTHHKLLSSLYWGREGTTPLIISHGCITQSGCKEIGIHQIKILLM